MSSNLSLLALLDRINLSFSSSFYTKPFEGKLKNEDKLQKIVKEESMDFFDLFL